MRPKLQIWPAGAAKQAQKAAATAGQMGITAGMIQACVKNAALNMSATHGTVCSVPLSGTQLLHLQLEAQGVVTVQAVS
jgi:hypothetical protein